MGVIRLHEMQVESQVLSARKIRQTIEQALAWVRVAGTFEVRHIDANEHADVQTFNFLPVL